MSTNKCWYKEMAVYQIWPRSFCDGNGDGIGDIKGIMSKLDYIKSLGVDAIWFSPLYKSPQEDMGYDIADYKDIAEEYGTLDEFKELLEAIHARGMKVIMDLVINHTSNQHKWFLESMKSKDNPYHDYYFWRDGKKGGKKPPNNWLSTFSGPAWKYNEDLNQYYLHLFAEGQPDLNMDNPKVREEIKDIMRFWLDMGVDGFREDVITFISKAEGLPNGFPLPVATGIEHYKSGPHLQEYLGEFRKVLDEYDCMTVGEAPMMTPKTAMKFIEENKDQKLNMMFHFQHMEADCLFYSWIRAPFSLRKLKNVYNNWQTKLYGKAWNTLYIENHDQPRIINRYGSLKYRVESGKMLATMYICQSGTPFIYQGQEIGMVNIGLPEIEMYEDVSTQNAYHTMRHLGFTHNMVMKVAKYASRDNARTPVQWSAEKNAGFTEGIPWYRVNPNYKEINVEQALADPESVFYHYQKLIQLRKEHEVMVYGTYQLLFPEDEDLYIYTRTLEEEKWLIVCNFHEKTRKLQCKRAGQVMLSNYADTPAAEKITELRPYEAVIYQMESWDANHGERGQDHSSDFEADIELV